MKGLIAAVILGGVFGSASAVVDSIDDTVMVLDLSVEVMSSADTVVAHLSFDEDPDLTLPLLDRGDGSFGLTTELEPKNYIVVFEVVGEEVSDPITLTQLGADLGPVSSGSTTTTEPGAMSDESRRNLWLAVALGAASLSVLAFWVLGGRKEPGDDEGVDGSDEEE